MSPTVLGGDFQSPARPSSPHCCDSNGNSGLEIAGSNGRLEGHKDYVVKHWHSWTRTRPHSGLRAEVIKIAGACRVENDVEAERFAAGFACPV